ncbi:STAS/SEC14 domain-containing protein [Photobacterium damselae subsp. damselae]|nr:STAS/SEC14 domain-containing protein [Photobacterium damselae]UKA31713.1 STAS/SEC14 domain-containing protein [Photobacterium damselae subsp. damselae]
MIMIHGLDIEIDCTGNHVFLELKACGKLTHSDYEKITPMIDEALESIDSPIVDMYFDGSEFSGWELRAAWDDLKLGLKHGKAFHKIALYGNQQWLEVGAKVGNWFISGEVKWFDEPLDALNWLRSE